MRKILFILNYRAGTNLWNFVNGRKEVNFFASLKTRDLVGGKPLINPDVIEPVVNYPGWDGGSSLCFWLPTIPEKICPCENYFASDINRTLVTKPPFDFFSWHVHIGDWWGPVESHESVPEPYEVVTPVRFGSDELLALGDDWKFIYIVRDGRNQIESLRNIPGGIEQQYHEANPWDYFQVLCKSFRNRARLALDCRSVPGFKMFRFEDFVSNCVGTMKTMYEHAGLTVDESFVQRAFQMTKDHKIQKQHSSFGSAENINRRFINWTQREIEKFEEIAGKEQHELGYK